MSQVEDIESLFVTLAATALNVQETAGTSMPEPQSTVRSFWTN